MGQIKSIAAGWGNLWASIPSELDLRVCRRHRPAPRALFALALMAFVQISIAAAGCLASRTTSVAEYPERAGCTVGVLLCRAHCQAQEQTLDPVQIPVLDTDELTPVLVPLVRVEPPLPRSSAGSQRLPPAVDPPPIILFARLLI